MTLYHDAARDGYLDILREANRRDCDKCDEDGMTPVLWAAYHGHLDALRTLLVRGGNPDRCDYLGNSALHLAAANSHFECVSYLVSFGCNLWCLDNEYRTPLEVAALNDRTDIVRYLDDVQATQSIRNAKLVKRFKEKAVLAAQKRVKKYHKLQSKAQKKADKADKRLAEERDRMLAVAAVEGSSSYSAPASVYSTVPSDRLSRLSISSQRTSQSEPRPYSAHFTSHTTGRQRGRLGGNVAKKIKGRTGSHLSEHGKSRGAADFKVSQTDMDGTKTIKSLAGLKRDPQILYTNKALLSPRQPADGHPSKQGARRSKMDDSISYHQTPRTSGYDDTISRAISEPDFALINDDSGIESTDSVAQDGPGLFERPGFGSVAFMHRRASSALMSLARENEGGEDDTDDDNNGETDNDQSEPTTYVRAGKQQQQVKSTVSNGTASFKSKKSKNKHSRVKRKGSCSDSIGTLGSLAARISDVPWNDSDVECLDEDDDLLESSPLELFLSACGLTEFLPKFTREKIDLAALMLLTDTDIRGLGLPLGPRRKLEDAIAKRKTSIENPNIIFDTRL